MEWKRGKQIPEDTVLRAVEEKKKISLPEDYRRAALLFSGGVPVRRIMDVGGRDRVFERLISADPGHHPNLADALDWVEEEGLVPFGMDPFGNLWCFSFSGEKSSIVFYDGEKGTQTAAAPSFSAFLSALRDR